MTEHKLRKCEDPESNLRQKARDQEQKLIKCSVFGARPRTCPWSPFALGPLPFGEDDFLDLRIFSDFALVPVPFGEDDFLDLRIL